MKWAIVDTETGVVTNTVLWDPQDPWTPPSGTYLVELGQQEVVSLGMTHRPSEDPRFVASPEPDAG